jgi:hypothetical protein
MKIGRYRHLLHALVGRFDGYPNGLLASDVGLDALLAWRGTEHRVDLLTDAVDPPPPPDPAARPMLEFLQALGSWLRARLAADGAAPGEVETATLTFRVGEPRSVDLSRHTTWRPGEVWRDAAGHAHGDRIETTEIVPEWRAVPVVPFAVRYEIRAKGRAFLRDEPDAAYRFMPERRRE